MSGGASVKLSLGFAFGPSAENGILLFSLPACFADEELPLDTDGAEILGETFNILSLKEMKLQAISSTAGAVAGEEPEEEERMATMTKAVLQAAQKKVVSQVSALNPCIGLSELLTKINKYTNHALLFSFNF